MDTEKVAKAIEADAGMALPEVRNALIEACVARPVGAPVTGKPSSSTLRKRASELGNSHEKRFV